MPWLLVVGGQEQDSRLCVRDISDSKKNTVTQTFVGLIPLSFISTCCHLILMMMMMMMMMIFSLVLQSKSSLGLILLTFLDHTQLEANTQ